MRARIHTTGGEEIITAEFERLDRVHVDLISLASRPSDKAVKMSGVGNEVVIFTKYITHIVFEKTRWDE